MWAMQKRNQSLQQQFSIMTGVSPGASVKREKLQQRNAILRRTGFIEGPACLRGVGGNAFQFFPVLLYYLGVLNVASTCLESCKACFLALPCYVNTDAQRWDCMQK